MNRWLRACWDRMENAGRMLNPGLSSGGPGGFRGPM
jgi:hypothetical protein